VLSSRGRYYSLPPRVKNSLDFDVLFVPGLTKNLLSVFVMENKGFAVEFKNQQVPMRLNESNLDTTHVIWIRGHLYRLL
jgi:hypothetical protein